MRNKLLFALPVAALAFAAPVTGWAQSNDSVSNLSTQDQQVIKQAGSINRGEVELGKLAIQKAHYLSVREFGHWMESAHGAANRELVSTLTRVSARQPSDSLTPQQTEAM